MAIERHYIINQHFMYMFGVRDRNAKVCTLVREFHRVFIVDRSPLEILEDSLRSIGFNLKGALDSSKIIIGNNMMCPVMLNHIHNICVFPDKSHKHEDTIWFNPCHILRTHSIKRKTHVEFRNRLILTIDSKLFSFNNKWKSAEQLSRITTENANNPVSYIIIEPPKKKSKRKSKNKTSA
nr:competence protein ComK [Neobacillus sp. Marseille-Q6967]